MRGALLTILFLAGEFASSTALLRVRPHVVVTPNSDVKMSMLVDTHDVSPDLLNKLAKLSLTVAPAYGEKQELSSANISAILRPLIQAERESANPSLQVVIPKTVVIDTEKRDLDPDMVQTELLQAWEPLCPECQLEIEGLSLPKVASIHDWTLHMKSELPRGSFSVPVELVRESGGPITAWINGRLVTKRKVPVASRSFNMGELLNPQDFTWQFRDTSFALDGAPSAEEVSGKRLRQGLRAGDILWKGMLEREKAIHAGDLVELKSSEGAFEVSLSVVAQQDAYIGDVIRLKNPNTNTMLMGQVTGQDEVELR